MLLNIHPDNPSPRKLETVNECLKEGGIVIFPTDTVYAIGCDLHSSKALKKVAQLKGKELKKAEFSILFHDLSQLSDYTKPIANPVFKLLKRSLPGPFTFILPASNKVPKLFEKNSKKTIGIRIPDNPIVREMVQNLGNPLVSTSVHHEDEVLEYSTDPEWIHDRFKNDVDIVINGGIGRNEASTVVDATNEVPEVLRQGSGELEAYS